jgi:hypothetical protein
MGTLEYCCWLRILIPSIRIPEPIPLSSPSISVLGGRGLLAKQDLNSHLRWLVDLVPLLPLFSLL